MFTPKLKKFLSGIMIAGDLLLGAVFFADLLSGVDISIDLIILAFLSADALLSLDYITRLTKEEQEESRKQRAYNASKRQSDKPDRRLDREMAEDISSSTEVLDMDPDELAELLSSHNQQQEEETYRR